MVRATVVISTISAVEDAPMAQSEEKTVIVVVNFR